MATVEQATTGGVSFELTSEQRDLRALAHEFAEKEIRPKAAEYDEHSTHPADVIAKAHEIGLMNPHIPEEYGGLGLSAFDGMLLGDRRLDRGQHARRRAGPARRERRAETRVAADADRGATSLLVRPHRAERRLGRLGHPDDRRAAGRRVRHQRLED